MTRDDLADLRERLAKLEEIEAARGLFHTYAQVLDEPVPEAVTALFTSDAVLTSPVGVAKGHEEIRSFFATAFAADPSVKRHFIVNPRATWLGPGQVRMQSYFLFTGRGQERSVIGWGTYDDLIDVSGEEPLFAAKVIDLHVGTDLAAGWAFSTGAPA